MSEKPFASAHFTAVQLNAIVKIIQKQVGQDGPERLLRGELVVFPIEHVLKPQVLKIDRTTPFDPAKFIGEGWSIWRGPRDGKGLKGEEEQDHRSLAITELETMKLVSQKGLIEDEDRITGEVKLSRLMFHAIQMDAKIGEVLFREENQITLKWLYKALNVTWIEFLGTILRDPHGNRFALYCYRCPDGHWRWRACWLGGTRDLGTQALGIEDSLGIVELPSGFSWLSSLTT